jgi:hypothetical protein
VGQGAWDTTVAHEAGHSLNLIHTQEGQSEACANGPPCASGCTPGNGDACSDTLPDAECWTRDDIAINAFGIPYSLLNDTLRYRVNLTWSNLMSYHDPDNRGLLSPCQLDRLSVQGFVDRDRLLSKVPVYVDSSYAGPFLGTFTMPFQTIQQAITLGSLSGRVLVLEQGTHPRPASAIATSTEVVTRNGVSTIQERPPPYLLPYALEESKNLAVRDAVVRAQQSDRRNDTAGVITSLLEAEKRADGRERSAIRLELAQRFRDSGRYEEAAAWFRRVAEGADQDKLRQHALTKEETMRHLATLQHRQQKAATK